MRAPLVTLLLLPACAGAPDDTGKPAGGDDTGEDTAPPTGHTLGDADASFVGDPSSAMGSAVTGLGDLDGDGRGSLLVAAFYGNRVCAWHGPVTGENTPASGACFDGEATYDFAGYALARVDDAGGGALVGAIGSDEAGIEAGKVYLLRDLSESGALADAPVTWTGEAAGDYAGTSLAPAGDVDGDGDGDVLVGASGVDAGGPGGGRVYLLLAPFPDGASSLADAWATFTGSSDTPPALFHGSSTGGDALGDAVTGLGDIDGDGVADLLLGASGADANGTDAGEVWVVRGPVAAGDHRAEDADARLVGPGVAAYAGGAVAGPGDLDGDGLADLLVAADGWEGGRVYVVPGPVSDGEGALESAVSILAGGTDEDLAGWSVAGAGDTDGDGRREVLVGAPGQDGGGADAGAVYLVHDATTPGVSLLDDVGTRWDGEAAGDAAGRAAAGAGDIDGDGLDDLLAGALYNQDGGVFAGKAYLVDGR